MAGPHHRPESPMHMAPVTTMHPGRAGTTPINDTAPPAAQVETTNGRQPLRAVTMVAAASRGTGHLQTRPEPCGQQHNANGPRLDSTPILIADPRMKSAHGISAWQTYPWPSAARATAPYVIGKQRCCLANSGNCKPAQAAYRALVRAATRGGHKHDGWQRPCVASICGCGDQPVGWSSAGLQPALHHAAMRRNATGVSVSAPPSPIRPSLLSSARQVPSPCHLPSHLPDSKTAEKNRPAARHCAPPGDITSLSASVPDPFGILPQPVSPAASSGRQHLLYHAQRRGTCPAVLAGGWSAAPTVISSRLISTVRKPIPRTCASSSGLRNGPLACR